MSYVSTGRRSLLLVVSAVLAAALLAGCSGTPKASRLALPELPDKFPNEAVFAAEDGLIGIQVGHFLDSELSNKYFLGDLCAKGVLGVYLRIENRSLTRVLASNANCRLFGKDGSDYYEIPQLPVGEVASEFLTSRWDIYALGIPISVMLMPVLYGFAIWDDVWRDEKGRDLKDAIICENLISVEWSKRALGPGAVEKGALFFDWSIAREYGDELYLTIDMRDLVNDWHTVVPVRLNTIPQG